MTTGHNGPGQRTPHPGVRAAVLAGVGTVALVTGAVVLATTDEQGPAGVAMGSGALAIAVALGVAARHLSPPPDESEPRHAPGGADDDTGDTRTDDTAVGDGTPSSQRRRLLIGGSLVAVAGAAAGGTALLRSRYDAQRELRRTAWRSGDALVTSDGRRIGLDDLAAGAMLTVWPDHDVGGADSQAVLLRIDPQRLGAQPRSGEATPDGYVAYSKLCTHMGCPVGLFQQDPDVLVCPCHQAVFDVLDGARPVQGPARRPLPQLPLAAGADGLLRARGDFLGPVGPGWWDRP